MQHHLFRFAMQNTLSKIVSLGYNLGAEWDGESPTPSWIYTIATGFNISDKRFSYVESYGFITKGSLPDHNVDAGVTSLFSKDAQLDLSGGFGLSSTSLKITLLLDFRSVSRQ